MHLLGEFLTNAKLQTPDTIQKLTMLVMQNQLTASQIGAFLVALKLLGKESDPQVVNAVAEGMRQSALYVSDLPFTVVDIVGTGGDGQNTFNVSTAASIVVAGAGCKVAKVLLF